jgi:hypothetical protein
MLAILGLRPAWGNQKTRVLVTWVVICLGLMVFPWNLQRRFLTGLYLPLAGLGIVGLEVIREKMAVNGRSLFTILMVLVIPTNLIVIVSGISASSRQSPAIFLSEEELSLYSWIKQSTAPDDLILTDQETGLYIPSQTGRRVIYGHPFETIRAEAELAYLAEFIEQEHDPSYYRNQIIRRGIDYIHLRSDPTASMRLWLDDDQIPEVYRNGDHVVYKAAH